MRSIFNDDLRRLCAHVGAQALRGQGIDARKEDIVGWCRWVVSEARRNTAHAEFRHPFPGDWYRHNEAVANLPHRSVALLFRLAVNEERMRKSVTIHSQRRLDFLAARIIVIPRGSRHRFDL